MKDKFKKLTIDLSDIFLDETMNFLEKSLDQEENTTDVIDLIVSSHISSMCSAMSGISRSNENIFIKVKKFQSDLLNFISKHEYIKGNVEFM